MILEVCRGSLLRGPGIKLLTKTSDFNHWQPVTCSVEVAAPGARGQSGRGMLGVATPGSSAMLPASASPEL